jgi:alkaline phosphatase D
MPLGACCAVVGSNGAMTNDRRRLLQLAAASAASLWLPRSAWSQPRLAGNPFILGVASGSPTDDSVVLWTRLMAPGGPASLSTAPITVRWEVAHEERFGRLAAQGQAQALADLAHSARSLVLPPLHDR